MKLRRVWGRRLCRINKKLASVAKAAGRRILGELEDVALKSVFG
jgi:hypothetical protein